MSESDALRSRLAALLERVRQASRDGAVLRLDEVWREEAEPGRLEDLAIVHEGRHAYLYSTRHMTRQYAETAARIAEGDITRLIAEAVRADSATYPRPTPVETFAGQPFGLAHDQISQALARMLADPGFYDIHTVTSSNGTLFLFSTRHLEPAHAASLAEWLAVGRSNNP
jgi:hypothetical protein